MNTYRVQLNDNDKTKIFLMGNDVSLFDKYSVSVDGYVVTFEYPVDGVAKVKTPDCDNKSDKSEYTLTFEDNSVRVIHCCNGRFNPEDPYTFLHDGGTYEFDRAIKSVEVTQEENNAIRRKAGNCPVQGNWIVKPEEIDAAIDRLYYEATRTKLYSEAAMLNRLKNMGYTKYSRRVLRILNADIEDNEAIKLLVEYVESVLGNPIRGFWRPFI